MMRWFNGSANHKGNCMTIDASQYEVTEDQLQAAIAKTIELVTSGNVENKLQMGTLIGVIGTYYIGKFDGVEPSADPSFVLLAAAPETQTGVEQLVVALGCTTPMASHGGMLLFIIKRLVEAYGDDIIKWILQELLG